MRAHLLIIQKHFIWTCEVLANLFILFVIVSCRLTPGVLRVVTFTTSEVTFFIFLKSEGHFEVTFEKCPKK